MSLLISCQWWKDGGPRDNSEQSPHLLSGKSLSSGKVSKSESLFQKEFSEGKMLQVFRKCGFPLFTKSSHMDQHWIGVNLFHLVLIFNWIKLRSTIKLSCLHTCWMWCVLAESILLLVGNRSLTFRWFMSIAKCYGKISIRRIMSWFEMDYFLQFSKSCLVKKNHVYLLKGKWLLKSMEIGTWHQMEYTSNFTVAPNIHTGCLMLYQTLCYFMRFSIRHMWMVWLVIFIEKRRVFGPRFLYQQKFVKLKISNRPRMRLVFWPPSNS